MSVFELYLIFTLPTIGYLLLIGAVISFSITLLTGLIVLNELGSFHSNEKKEEIKKRAGSFYRKIIPLTIALAIVSALIPSHKTLKYMIGGYVITNADGIENLPDNVVKAANEFLERYNEQNKEDK